MKNSIEIESKIANLQNNIEANNASMLSYEEVIAHCDIEDCEVCCELQKEVEQLEKNIAQCLDTIQCLNTELALESMPIWRYTFARSDMKIYDCLIRAMSYQESLNAFTVTHQENCILVDVLLIAE